MRDLSWKTNKYKMLVFQKNLFLLMSIMSSISLMVCALFIKSMYESKTVEPYLINIDKNTGIPSVVEWKSFKDYTAQDAIKEYFLIDYIINRELVNSNTSEKDIIEKIRIYSSPGVFKRFKSQRSSTLSKTNSLGPDIKSSIKIGNINYITPKKVEIKFEITYQSLKTGKSSSSRFSAYIDFDFLNLKYTAEERRSNPLGFQVISYTLTEDVFK